MLRRAPVHALLFAALLAQACGDPGATEPNDADAQSGDTDRDASDTGEDAATDATLDPDPDGLIDAPDADEDTSIDSDDTDPDGAPDADDARTDATAPDAIPHAECGDGVRGGDELCDEGANNALAPDRCRPDCRLPVCGDEVIDSGEACDDGNRWGGDGCSSTCTIETESGESEPNNAAATAEAMGSGGVVLGALPARDSDCFAVTVREPGWVSASVTACEGDTWLRLLGPDGAVLATNDDAGTGSRCSGIDAARVPAARYLRSGVYTICVEGFLGSAVASYRLAIETGADACDPGRFEPDASNDLDGDRLADACDDDDDGDGMDDISDNCPRVANNGVPLVPSVDANGAVRDWLIAGPYAQTAPTECLPADADFFDDVGVPQPEIGDPAGERSPGGAQNWWRSHADSDALLDFTSFLTASAPRAVYAYAWVFAPSARSALLRLGSDDGVRVWLNETEIFARGTCRGASPDADTVEIELLEGANRLLFKVQDNGGGWGLYARFVDSEGAPMTDLRAGRSSDPDALDEQNDLDADGIGDACDPETAPP